MHINDRLNRWRRSIASVLQRTSAYSYSTTDQRVEHALTLQDRDKSQRECDLIAGMIPREWTIALDVGCGVGHKFACFDHPTEVARCLIGIEPDGSRADASRRAASQMKHIVAHVLHDDVTVLRDLPEGDADVALCIQVVGHVTKSEFSRIVHDIHMSLRVDGTFILCVPVIGACFVGEPGSEGWAPPDDFWHVVNLTAPPFSRGFRRGVTASEFDAIVTANTHDQILPVRSFYLDTMPHDAATPMPFRIGHAPVAVREIAEPRFELAESLIYSVHLLGPEVSKVAVADLVLLYRKA